MCFLQESRPIEDKFSYLWGVFMWVHVNFSIIIHTVSIWLTLSLAIWRNRIKLNSSAFFLLLPMQCCGRIRIQDLKKFVTNPDPDPNQTLKRILIRSGTRQKRYVSGSRQKRIQYHAGKSKKNCKKRKFLLPCVFIYFTYLSLFYK